VNKPSLSICIPSSGRDTRSIKRQLSLINLLLSHANRNGTQEVEAIITFNCRPNCQLQKIAEAFTGLVHFNNKDLGFDANVLKCINLARGEYIHLLSDNDYLCAEHFAKIINITSTIRKTKGQIEKPSFIIPLEHSYDVPQGLDYQYRLIEILKVEADNGNDVRLESHENLCGSILLCSQISHFIAKLDSSAVKKLNQLAHREYAHLGGIAQSAYAWCLAYSNRSRKIATLARVTMLNRESMIFTPTRKRSQWFYTSTLLDAPDFYAQLPLNIKRLFDIDLDENETRACSMISQSLIRYGETLLESEVSCSFKQTKAEELLHYWLRFMKQELIHLRRTTLFNVRYARLHLGYVLLLMKSEKTSRNWQRSKADYCSDEVSKRSAKIIKYD